MLQLRLAEIHPRDGLKLFDQRELFGLFGPISIEDIGKISFSMPLATLVIHTNSEEVLLEARASVRKEDLDLLVIESSFELLSDLSPVGVDPEADRLKGAGRP